ncbi:MAG: LysM peptidoglycan-binding domain-containing protein [Bacteroidales bacterium]|nr:LysM peptidoglycan-binding domain-containing protein [Bacteroidales bacterium]
MKRNVIIKVMTALALTMGSAAAALGQEYQNTPVTISKDKVRHNGEVCYSHIVKERQTLYSISKAYNVSIEDIYKYNPSVKENGLKINTILIIPIAGEATQTNADVAVEMAAEPVVEAVAKTEEAQTPVAETVSEPEVKPEVKVEPVTEPEDEDIVIKRKTHTVRWFEDLDTIAEKYGVTVEALMEINGLTGRKLTKRQKLIIPTEEEAAQAQADDNGLEDGETLLDAPDTTAVTDTLMLPEMPSKKIVDLSLMLPFNASSAKGSSSNNIDFYSGVLLAIYEMSQNGVSTSLDTYDIADGKIKTDLDSLKNENVVIGPVSTGDLTRLFKTAPEDKMVVSPLDQRAEKLVYEHSNMIQAPTPYSVIYTDLMAWMKEDLQEGDRAIVVTEKGARATEAVQAMMAAVDSSKIEYKALSYSILEGRDVPESLAWLMTEDETASNRVFIASESEAFVNDVVRNLNVMIHKKYKVVLYAPGRIRNFETIEVDNFHNSNLHVSLGYYIDYDDAKVKEFLLKYRALYNSEPTQFSFQGYDLAKYFIGLCSKYGENWTQKLESSDSKMLQSIFRFRKTEAGGYINTGVHRLVYGEGYQIISR